MVVWDMPILKMQKLQVRFASKLSKVAVRASTPEPDAALIWRGVFNVKNQFSFYSLLSSSGHSYGNPSPTDI
jgi:hypothetical protein